MKPLMLVRATVLVAASLLTAASALAAASTAPRQTIPADAHWKFFLGDPPGAETVSFPDAAWRGVNLPHDWSIEGIPEKANPTGSGGGYFPAGVGWYRKTFTPRPDWKGKRVAIEFDGVCMNATVYLNGKKLGFHPYAYTSFRYDLTDGLVFNRRNVLAVRIDESEQPSSRWYTGAGIYRHVRVVVNDPIHIAPWGVFVTTTEAAETHASVLVRTDVDNDTRRPVDLTVKTTLLLAKGASVVGDPSLIHMPAQSHQVNSQTIVLAHPAIWSPETPTVYRAITEVTQGGKLVDRVETTFGVRTLAWSASDGLSLNGKTLKLAGGSVHHDNGPLGAAAFDRAEERKVELLKAAGFNAVRTAHNPPSPAFLNACDRLGLLVLEDAFDVWTIPKAKYDYAGYFTDWWPRDIDAMVLRDRNHPSIIFWGIGNEIPEAWTKAGAPLATQLAARVRLLDSTRPVTEAFPGATYTASTDAVMTQLDVSGYNYNLKQNQERDHERVPKRIMMTTESLASTAFDNWQLAHDKPYILGEFVWTAMDYLGESGIGSWSYATPERAAQAAQAAGFMGQAMANMGADGKNPFETLAKPPDSKASPAPDLKNFLFGEFPWHASDSGDMDLTGYRKPQSYYRDILWNGGDRVFATVRLPEPKGQKIVAIAWSVYPTLPSWSWPGQEGRDLQVEVYASTDAVRLYLNEKLIGEMPTSVAQQRRAVFTVPYTPGSLKAVGVDGGQVVATTVLQTVGDAVQLRLTADRKSLRAGGDDLAFITVEAIDAESRLQINAAQSVQLAVSGAGTIVALGNGDGTSTNPYQGDRLTLFHGRGLVVVRTGEDPGTIHLKASFAGMPGAEVTLQADPSTEGANPSL